jgi:DNA-binding GntR family transcriptional regulator
MTQGGTAKDMATRRYPKELAVAEELMEKIQQALQTESSPAGLRDLAEAFHAVATARDETLSSLITSLAISKD